MRVRLQLAVAGLRSGRPPTWLSVPVFVPVRPSIGYSHRGQTAIARLQKTWPTVIPVHTPVHASWLNQVEIYFSIIQRKVLTPNDFTSLAEVEDCLLRFQAHYEQVAAPFEWKFTRQDLNSLLAKVNAKKEALAVAA